MDSYPRFLRDPLFLKLVELELDNRIITEDDILKIGRGESIDPKKKENKRKSTFQVIYCPRVVITNSNINSAIRECRHFVLCLYKRL